MLGPNLFPLCVAQPHGPGTMEVLRTTKSWVNTVAMVSTLWAAKSPLVTSDYDRLGPDHKPGIII